MKKIKLKTLFTMVELILVIAIIAFLTVTATVVLSQWLSKSRDSRRMADIAQIEKGVETAFIINNKFPMPDSYVNITSSGTVFNYQGKFCDTATEKSNIKATPKDPSDNACYTYETTTDQNKFQLMAFMENTDARIGFNENAILAVDYTKRTPAVKGDKLGILIASGTNQPVEDTGTGVDIVNTNTEFVSYFTNTNTIKGTGLALKSLKSGGELAYGLVGYWSFDEGTGIIAYDSSGKGNNGKLLGNSIPQWTGGKVNNGLFFSGNRVEISGNNNYNFNDFTISLYSYYNGNSTISSNSVYTRLISRDNYNTGVPRNNFGSRLYLLSGWNNENCNKQILFFILKNGIVKGMCSKYQLINNGWYYLTFVREGQYIKLYINGVLDNSMNTGIIGELTFNDDIPLTIGRIRNNIGVATEYFNGVIDEVRVYNRALSNSEVGSLYNSLK